MEGTIMSEDNLDESSDEPKKADQPYFEDLAKTEKDFMKDPTDFTDVAAIHAQKQRNKKIAIILVSVLSVLGILLFAVKIMENDTPEPTPTPTKTEIKNPDTPQKQAEANKPLLKEYPEAPEVISKEIVVKLNKTQLETPTHKLSFTSTKLTNESGPCKVVEKTDFCLAARGVTNKIDYSVFFAPDAAHSRMFENPKTFTKVDVPGAKVAGLLTLDKNDKDTPALVIVHDDSSGWLIIPDNANEEQLKTILTNLKAS